jgi:hypothetical protein
MKKRKSKKDDNHKVQEAYKLLMDLIENNQKHIEPTLWIGAMICSLSENFEKSDIVFEDFRKEMIACIDHYKY